MDRREVQGADQSIEVVGVGLRRVEAWYPRNPGVGMVVASAVSDEPVAPGEGSELRLPSTGIGGPVPMHEDHWGSRALLHVVEFYSIGGNHTPCGPGILPSRR